MVSHAGYISGIQLIFSNSRDLIMLIISASQRHFYVLPVYICKSVIRPVPVGDRRSNWQRIQLLGQRLLHLQLWMINAKTLCWTYYTSL